MNVWYNMRYFTDFELLNVNQEQPHEMKLHFSNKKKEYKKKTVYHETSFTTNKLLNNICTLSNFLKNILHGNRACLVTVRSELLH
jgi:hypothetical protein